MKKQAKERPEHVEVLVVAGGGGGGASRDGYGGERHEHTYERGEGGSTAASKELGKCSE